MKNFFVNLFGLVTRNWGLKILALVLAIVLYYTLKPTAGTHRWDNTHHNGNFFQSR